MNEKKNNNLKLKLNKTKHFLGNVIGFGGLSGVISAGPTLMVYGGCAHVDMKVIAAIVGGVTLLGGVAGGILALDDIRVEESEQNFIDQTQDSEKILLKK